MQARADDNLRIVRYDPKAGHRTLDLMRRGLAPYSAKDIKIGFSTINAMAETVDKKPVFPRSVAAAALHCADAESDGDGEVYLEQLSRMSHWCICANARVSRAQYLNNDSRN